jgi:hypothetical protein
MSGYGGAPGQFGQQDDTELQRQYEEYHQQQQQGRMAMMPQGMMMMMPVMNMGMNVAGNAAGGADYYRGPSPTGLMAYAPQNYAGSGDPSALMTSANPAIIAQPQGIAAYGLQQQQQPVAQLPTDMPVPHYGVLPQTYHLGPYPTMPGPPNATVSAFPFASPPASSADVATPAPSANVKSVASIYAVPEPLTHPRAPKSATTLEQIKLMQEAFKREQDTSRRRSHSSYSEAAARRAVLYGVRPGSVTSASNSLQVSPTSSSGSMNHSINADQDSKSRYPTIITKRKDKAVLDEDEHGKPIVVDGENAYYMGSAQLGMEDDKYWLSELQVYLRANFVEAFAATEDDIAVLMHGRNKPLALGQVGIRCVHCKNDSPEERGQQATSYPSLISGIYNSVQQMLRLHVDCCLSMPNHVRQKIEYLKLSCSSRGGRKQYWVDSAKRIGLTDTATGIHFTRDPDAPLPPLTGPCLEVKAAPRKKKSPTSASTKKPKYKSAVVEPAVDNYYAAREAEVGGEEEETATAPDRFSEVEMEMPVQPPHDARPIVFPDDKPLISESLYLTMEQMAPCVLMEADRVGCYKTREVGFPGIACRHCVGQSGSGRYFPASEASISQTTTSQTIMNHVRSCRSCPASVREALEAAKRARPAHDGKRLEKPKHGGRKVFFHRLWSRIQGLPIEDVSLEDITPNAGRGGNTRNGRRKRADDEEVDEDEMYESEDEAESDAGDDSNEKGKIHGCVRLTKTDDPHWLSDMECFARTELVEVFSYMKHDSLDGYSGRKFPSVGQVGVRCIYCKELEPHERANGCIYFPDSLSSLHSKVSDMVRLHFPSCTALPDNVRQTYKSLRGFDAKVSTDDSHHYWIDSASDMGLSNNDSSKGKETWGIIFRRDPLGPSPADELDLESLVDDLSGGGANVLVKADDRGTCTDQVLLLMRQVLPCRFRNSDKRGGTNSRSRDLDE